MLFKFPRPSLLINCFLTGKAGLHDRCFLGARKRFCSSGCTSHERPTSGQTVVIERQGPVLTVGINRPEVRNAVNQETSQRLFEEFSAFEQDDTLSVAVLHGIGGNFCAGYDLKELSQHFSSIRLEQNVTQGPAPMGPSRLRLSKPLIAAVSGYAVAGGLELALLADLRIVETSAIFGVFCRRFGMQVGLHIFEYDHRGKKLLSISAQIEESRGCGHNTASRGLVMVVMRAVNYLGVPLIDGGTVRLPQLIGLSRALDLILTGRPVGSQEALAFGLANRVVPDGQALQVAVELAEQISSFPQLCLRADRNSAYHASFDSSSFTQAMQYETDYGLPVLTAEAVPGATSFSSGTGRGGTFS